MASTPFSTATVTFAGQSPGKVVDVPTGLRKFYLGLPGNMIQLPPPQIGYTANGSTGESAQGLLSGGMAVMRTPRTKRAYVLNWQRLAGRDWQIVEGFYRRLFGYGPWCFVSPDDRNRLPTSAALAGAPNGDISKFATAVGTLTYDSTDAPPISPSGVVQWAGAGVASSLVLGKVVGGLATPDIATTTSTGTSAPYIPSEPVTFSIYARTASATASASVSATGRQANGTVTSTVTSSNVTLTTAWQRVSVTATAGALGAAPYVLGFLTCNTASAPNILVACPQLEYSSAATEWAVDSHVPRVIASQPLPQSLDGILASATSLTLVEA
jgi:hypothetical protein